MGRGWVFQLEEEKEPFNRQNCSTMGWGPWEEEQCLSPSVWEGSPLPERRLGPALKCHLLPSPRCLGSLAVMTYPGVS